MSQIPGWNTIKEVADDAGVRPVTVTKAIRAGRLRARKEGTAIFVSDADMAAYRNRNRPGRPRVEDEEASAATSV